MLVLKQPTSLEEIEAYYDLRWRILREPWEQPRGSERDELETIAYHMAAYDEQGSLLGIGRLHREDDIESQIRYMAVEEDTRGKGIGRAIVEGLESIAQAQGAKCITLNSRKSAVEFYERLGYRVTGAGPTLFGTIEHSTMAKNMPSIHDRNS